VCVKDLKLVRYHNKEAKCEKMNQLNFRIILMGFLNGLIRNSFFEVHLYWKKRCFVVFSLPCFFIKKTLDVPLRTWKKYGGNQCKLVVISKI